MSFSLNDAGHLPRDGSRAEQQGMAGDADLLAAAFDHLPVGVLVYDRHGRVRHANRELGELFDLDPAALVGQVRRELFERELAPRLRLDRALRDELRDLSEQSAGLSATLELDARRPRVLRYSSAPLVAPDGRRIGRVEVFADLTEQRAAERLEEQFLSVAAHDLKTPVTAIRGYAQLATRHVQRGSYDDLARQLEIVQQSTDVLVDLLNRLLDASRIRTGRLVLEREPVDLAQLARRVVERAAAAQAQPRLRLESAVGLVGRWDADRIEQALRSLIEHAVRRSPADGEVRIRLERQDDQAVVTVADEGPPIPTEQLARVYERVGQDGRPLGLSQLDLFIARGIVEAHGGRALAESWPPRSGAVFGFALPLD